MIPGTVGEVAAPSGPLPSVAFQPIMDVARGFAAGYSAMSLANASLVTVTRQYARDLSVPATVRLLEGALASRVRLPRNCFLSIHIGLSVVADERVRQVLDEAGPLAGLVLDLVGPEPEGLQKQIAATVGRYRAAGALTALGGGDEFAQPELSAIAHLRPSIIRLGRDWVREVEHSDTKRRAIEVIGEVANQMDAWVLAEGVRTAAEMRVLAGLGVPLAEGPFVGGPAVGWTAVRPEAVESLPVPDAKPDRALRSLLQPTYATRDIDAAQRLMATTPGLDAVVVVDVSGRPRAQVWITPSGDQMIFDVEGIDQDLPAIDAARRATDRPEAERHAPLVIVDDVGGYEGIVRIERLHSYLESISDRGPSPDGPVVST